MAWVSESDLERAIEALKSITKTIEANPELSNAHALDLHRLGAFLFNAEELFGDIETLEMDNDDLEKEVNVLEKKLRHPELIEAEHERDAQEFLLKKRYGTTRPPSIHDYWIGQS